MVAPREIADVDELRTLAHPLRQRILRFLGQHGPATASIVGKALGESSGATSYHLRMLAKHAFVEEVPERAHGRERWWRAPAQDLRSPRAPRDPEVRALVEQLNQLKLAADQELFASFLERRAELGEWADALPYSRGSVRVTLDELHEFFDEYMALLKRYQRPVDETPADARHVAVRFFAFPVPGVTPGDPS
ncbi:helix-turn-helix domain-containing protein [Saccharothrix sp. S26]|uniref:ArsR/SmtB family transcription factor n=1 Tax=Saccharothrix sp. S26 TaxID=2907215 RepID=UPI001F324F11|nr:helix-turn-helix domain-containing protein [Saccharothrix sp. S26]MCE6994639.1 helix-turn-helix domain-containing protein [Saccharothrix sp. S26]